MNPADIEKIHACFAKFDSDDRSTQDAIMLILLSHPDALLNLQKYINDMRDTADREGATKEEVHLGVVAMLAEIALTVIVREMIGTIEDAQKTGGLGATQQ